MVPLCLSWRSKRPDATRLLPVRASLWLWRQLLGMQVQRWYIRHRSPPVQRAVQTADVVTALAPVTATHAPSAELLRRNQQTAAAALAAGRRRGHAVGGPCGISCIVVLNRHLQPYPIPPVSLPVFVSSQGIIHRDIKPENILLGANKTIKVADFGLSINIHHERPVTRAGSECLHPSLDWAWEEQCGCWGLDLAPESGSGSERTHWAVVRSYRRARAPTS